MFFQVLGASASILTIVALAIAVWQSWQAQKQTKALQEIHQSLTTRYLGKYPEFLSAIVPLLDSAKASLTVLTDCPAYAGFSNQEQELRARHAIEQKLKQQHFQARLVFRTEPERRAITHLQFESDDAKWKQWKSKPPNQDLLKQFFGQDRDIDALTFADFEDELERNDQEVLNGFRRAARIQGNVRTGRVRLVEDPRQIPVNFWIADGKKAVFSLISYSASGPDSDIEYGFETSDARLIASLEGVAEDVLGSQNVVRLPARHEPPALPAAAAGQSS